MDHILGREVENIKGKVGIIVALENRYITVEFDDGTKRFQYPDAFTKYLRACDTDVEEWIEGDKIRIPKETETRKLEELARREKEKKSEEAKFLQEKRKAAYLEAQVLDRDLLLRLGMYDVFHDVYEELRDLCADEGVPATYEMVEGIYNISEFRKNKEPAIIRQFCQSVITLVREQWTEFQDEPYPGDAVLKKRYDQYWKMIIWSDSFVKERERFLRIGCISFNGFLFRVMEVMFDSKNIPYDIQIKLKERLIEIFDSNEYIPVLPQTMLLEGVVRELTVYKTLYNISCNVNKHSVIPSIGVLEVDDREISIPLHYCEMCKKAFIGKESLKFYTKTCGDFQTTIYEEPDYFGDLQRSELYRYGYNVRADGMSRKQRRNLLVSLYETRKLTEFQIRRDLEKNIFMFKNNKSFRFAVKKWNEDLEFFNLYLLQNN